MKSTDRINLKKPKQTNNNPTNFIKSLQDSRYLSWFCFGFFNSQSAENHGYGLEFILEGVSVALLPS